MVYISETDLHPADFLKNWRDNTAGAVVLFSGETRIDSNKRTVDYLFYESHVELAEKYISDIISEAKNKWQLAFAHGVHRIGKVSVGECAVVVITASKHRKEAYAANQYIIDRIKHEAPIWKCEYYTDGTHTWGGNCNCFEKTNEVNKHIYEFEPK